MRHIARITAEITKLREIFGEARVVWAPDYSWVQLLEVPLPPGLTLAASDMLLVIPDRYGYGMPLRELYVDPGLRVRREGKWVEIPHYFDRQDGYSPNRQMPSRNWRYLCLHNTQWKTTDSIFTFLQQVRLFLSAPFRWD